MDDIAEKKERPGSCEASAALEDDERRPLPLTTSRPELLVGGLARSATNLRLWIARAAPEEQTSTHEQSWNQGRLQLHKGPFWPRLAAQRGRTLRVGFPPGKLKKATDSVEAE